MGADLKRYYAHLNGPHTRFRHLRMAMMKEAIWAIWLFRFGQYLYHEANPLIRILLVIPYRLTVKLTGLTVGIHLYPQTRIGPGFHIGHYGGIWISPRATLGANCSVCQGVTIGVAGKNENGGPVLGDRVWVGPNAIVTGNVKVGSGAVIGANSLVASDIPENGVAVGVPARVISYTGSKNLIVLPENNTPQSD